MNRTTSFVALSSLSAALLGACSSKSGSEPPPATVTPPPPDDTCTGPCPGSNVKHLIVVIQENHTFDNHFGAYCTAPTGSNPTCTNGPSCCEAAPATDPAGKVPVTLTDEEMGGHDPSHTFACETVEMNGGKMDSYATATCGSPRNVAYSDPALVKPYWDMATNGALADRYFQPVVGQSSSNDMYFARAAFVFSDNDVGPKGALGETCGLASPPGEYTDTTIGDLLTAKGVPWTFYAEGYKAMSDAIAAGTCPKAPADCPAGLGIYPCIFDASDIPFEYYPSTRDNPATMKDLQDFEDAITGGSLPAVSFIKAIGYKTEHPGLRDTLSAGVKFVSDLANLVEASRYQSNTLVLVTYDEGGGYFDHVSPPAASAVDGKPYGTRVPLLAIGPFARKGTVSHTTMEHSSIVKFIEWNWLDGVTGQLKTRDAQVNNLGSMLDPTATGVAVPE